MSLISPTMDMVTVPARLPGACRPLGPRATWDREQVWFAFLLQARRQPAGPGLFLPEAFCGKLAQLREEAGMESGVQPAALPPHGTRQLRAAAALTALGIVYGDIGTSPLYAFKQAAEASGTPSPETILGVVSLILWTLILV